MLTYISSEMFDSVKIYAAKLVFFTDVFVSMNKNRMANKCFVVNTDVVTRIYILFRGYKEREAKYV